jgi:hypothetical protein
MGPQQALDRARAKNDEWTKSAMQIVARKEEEIAEMPNGCLSIINSHTILKQRLNIGVRKRLPRKR